MIQGMSAPIKPIKVGLMDRIKQLAGECGRPMDQESLARLRKAGNGHLINICQRLEKYSEAHRSRLKASNSGRTISRSA
jgi:sensor histidine kinase YesM